MMIQICMGIDHKFDKTFISDVKKVDCSTLKTEHLEDETLNWCFISPDSVKYGRLIHCVMENDSSVSFTTSYPTYLCTDDGKTIERLL